MFIWKKYNILKNYKIFCRSWQKVKFTQITNKKVNISNPDLLLCGWLWLTDNKRLILSQKLGIWHVKVYVIKALNWWEKANQQLINWKHLLRFLEALNGFSFLLSRRCNCWLDRCPKQLLTSSARRVSHKSSLLKKLFTLWIGIHIKAEWKEKVC